MLRKALVATCAVLALGFVFCVPVVHSRIAFCNLSLCVVGYSDVWESVGCSAFGVGASYVPKYQWYGSLTYEWGCDPYFGHTIINNVTLPEGEMYYTHI